jgi:hypothetical protein
MAADAVVVTVADAVVVMVADVTVAETGIVVAIATNPVSHEINSGGRKAVAIFFYP